MVFKDSKDIGIKSQLKMMSCDSTLRDPFYTNLLSLSERRQTTLQFDHN